MLNTKLTGGGYAEIIGCIEIMDNVFFGANVTILNDVRRGANSIVAAGAVVTKDDPENSVVGGVPASVICTMDEYLEKRKNLYPKEMSPNRQVVSTELEYLMWDDFKKRHDSR